MREPFETSSLLQVGVNTDHQVVVKLPDRTKILKFTPFQARHLAQLLHKHADRVDAVRRQP